MIKKFSFTLSEVLLTLVVIGVVATLTIPVAFHGYTKMVTKIKLNKFASDFKAVMEESENDNFGKNLLTTAGYDDQIKLIVPYLSVMKNCGKNHGCVPEKPYLRKDKVNHYDFNSTSPEPYYKIILNNGFIVIFDPMYGCHPSDPEHAMFSVYVDINGERGPNTECKDLFMFDLLMNGKFGLSNYEGCSI